MRFSSGIPNKKKDGRIMVENVELKSSYLDLKILKKHRLNVLSKPEYFMEALFP